MSLQKKLRSSLTCKHLAPECRECTEEWEKDVRDVANQIQDQTQTLENIVKNHKARLKVYEEELKTACGGVAVVSARARFKQKDNERWVKLSDVKKALLEVSSGEKSC